MAPLPSNQCSKVPILTHCLTEELNLLQHKLEIGRTSGFNNKEMVASDLNLSMANISASMTEQLFVIETHQELGNNSNSDEISKDINQTFRIVLTKINNI